mgnify:FL=1
MKKMWDSRGATFESKRRDEAVADAFRQDSSGDGERTLPPLGRPPRGWGATTSSIESDHVIDRRRAPGSQ